MESDDEDIDYLGVGVESDPELIVEYLAADPIVATQNHCATAVLATQAAKRRAPRFPNRLERTPGGHAAVMSIAREAKLRKRLRKIESDIICATASAVDKLSSSACVRVGQRVTLQTQCSRNKTLRVSNQGSCIILKTHGFARRCANRVLDGVALDIAFERMTSVADVAKAFKATRWRSSNECQPYHSQ